MEEELYEFEPNDESNDESNDEPKDESNDESDDELDEDTKNLMYNRSLKNIDDIYYIKETIINKEVLKKNPNIQIKKISLSEYNKEPQKFISKRVNDRKKELGLYKEPTRQFNPRLPPFNLVFRKKEYNNVSLDLNSHTLFPCL